MTSCLIVDDSRTIRTIARRMYEAEGFTCSEAENGRRALEICHTQLPQLIMVDWNMPEMNGIDFVTAVRRMPGGDEPVVILCTTENDLDHIQIALAAGANEYIMKPFDNEIVRSKLRLLGLVAATGD